MPVRAGLPLMRPTWGRCADYFVLANGTTVTPYDLTCAIEHLPGLARYQIVQRSPSRVEVLVEPGAGFSSRRCGTAIQSALRSVLHGLTPQVRRRTDAPARAQRQVQDRALGTGRWNGTGEPDG